MTIPDTIDLTPNYEVLFEQFARELPNASKQLMKNPTLETFHKWLAPFVIAFESAGTKKQVLQLREHVATVLAEVAAIRRD
jgi:hypothetical protein